MSTQFSPDKNKTSPLHDMMTSLVTSGVSNHPHPAVRLQFFETITRYDRYFSACASIDQQSSVIATTTQAFFDHRGLRSSDPKVRSRCAYLMSRYVKTLGKLLSPYAVEILNEINGMLVLNPVNGVERLLSNDDQLFIYELAGNLIVNSQFAPEKKAALMTDLLRPLVENFQPVLVRMKALASEEVLQNGSQPSNDTVEGSETYATALNYMMSYASRTSKAFNNKLTMSHAGCAAVYTDALKVFLQALNTDVHRTLIHTGVRQYLHRMVICLEEEVLPFVPITIQHLLSNEESKSLHDFIPLLNQVICKFKKTIEPFLREVFVLVVRAIFDVLSRQNANDTLTQDDIKTIRRTYFQFLHALVSNNVGDVILQQALPDLELVLNTLVEGAVESYDPLAQKTCFSILTKLVQVWGSETGISLLKFIEESGVPACFLAPMKPQFDLSDAQTVLALNESANFMKTMYKREGLELENYLRQRYLPSLQLPSEKIEEYCQALKSEVRIYRAYLKAFFMQAKT